MSDAANTPEQEGENAEDKLVQVGDEIDLIGLDPALRNISIRAGWDAKSYDGNEIDMDISLIFLNAQDQTIKDEDFIFYNNPEAYDGAVKHHGDSRHGAGAGDDEQIDIDLQSIPFDYLKIVIAVSIYRGGEFDQNLGDVSNGFVRVVNEDSGQQLVRYRLDADLREKEQTAMVAATIERIGAKWIFKPIAEFVEGGLGEIASRYGLIIATQ